MVLSPNRKWCHSASSLKTMGSYDYRRIYLRNWWACKCLESAMVNTVQESVRYMSSGWINSNTGLSRWRGPLIPTPFWVEWGVGGGGPWPVDKQPLRWPPTLAPSWQPLPQPGSSTLQWKKILLLSTARLGIPDRAFTRTPGEPDTRLNSLNF